MTTLIFSLYVFSNVFKNSSILLIAILAANFLGNPNNPVEIAGIAIENKLFWINNFKQLI